MELALKSNTFSVTIQITAIIPFRAFKVTDFGTNRKPTYDFLLVNNTNLHSTRCIVI